MRRDHGRGGVQSVVPERISQHAGDFLHRSLQEVRVRHHGQVVAEIPNRELADEAPLYDRPHTVPLRRVPLQAPEMPAANVQEALPALLAAPDISFKRWIWEQYDYQVRTNTVAGPDRSMRYRSGETRRISMSRRESLA